MNRNSIIIAIVVCLIFGGCASDELAPANRQSELIRFGTSMRMEPLTKTSYASDVSGGTIYWDTNDAVKIVAVSNGTIASQDIYTVRVNGDKTTGRLDGGGLTWRPGDEYRFYGLYPEDLVLDAGQVHLSVEGKQPKDIDMRQVYMAARTDCGYSSEAVSMEFYPLVTTLTLKVTNETKSSVDLSDIDLTYGGGKYLAGSYAVGIDASGSSLARDNIAWPENKNAVDGVQNFVTIRDKVEIQSGGIDRFNFLLIPQTYSGKDMTLSFQAKGKEYSADLSKVGTIYPGYRYFIDVTIKENGEITPPVAPPIDSLSSGGVQILASFLVILNNAGKIKDYFDNDTDYWDFQHNCVDRLRNPPHTPEELAKYLENDKYRAAFEKIIESMTEINSENTGNLIKDNVSATDLLVFKNLERLTIQTTQSMSITIKAHPSLQYFAISSGSNGTLTLDIDDCESLTAVDLTQLNQNDPHDIDISGCKNLTSVSRNNSTKQSIRITNCNPSVNTE